MSNPVVAFSAVLVLVTFSEGTCDPQGPNLIVVIGGKKINRTRLIGGPPIPSRAVDILTPGGICPYHEMNLTIPLCNHKAVSLPESGKILVCGWQLCDDATAQSSSDKSRISEQRPTCSVWSKDEPHFKLVDSWTTRLPEVGEFPSQNFDLIQNFNDTLYFRPWMTNNFYKGRIGPENKIVWEKRSPLPLSLDYACAVIFQKNLFVIGGRWFDRNGNVQYSSNVFQYIETPNNQEVGWTMKESMDLPMFNITCLPYGDRGILVFGGQVFNDSDPVKTATSVKFWNAELDSWNVKEPEFAWERIDPVFVPFQEARYEFGAGEFRDLDGKSTIFIFGGYDPLTLPRNPRFLSNMEEYDIANQRWKFPGTHLSEERSGMAYVDIPASWIPDCENYQSSSQCLRSSQIFYYLITIIFTFTTVILC